MAKWSLFQAKTSLKCVHPWSNSFAGRWGSELNRSSAVKLTGSHVAPPHDCLPPAVEQKNPVLRPCAHHRPDCDCSFRHFPIRIQASLIRKG